MLLYLIIVILIIPANSDYCNGWGKVAKQDPKFLDISCPDDTYKMLIQGNLCCIPQPDCPPGLIPETALYSNKYYNGSLEIGCIEAPETTSKSSMG